MILRCLPSPWDLIILSTHVSGHIYSTKVWRSNRINDFSFQLISEFGNTWWSARNHSQFHHYLKHLFTLILYPCIYILYCLSEKSYIHLYPIFEVEAIAADIFSISDNLRRWTSIWPCNSRASLRAGPRASCVAQMAGSLSRPWTALSFVLDLSTGGTLQKGFVQGARVWYMHIYI